MLRLPHADKPGPCGPLGSSTRVTATKEKRAEELRRSLVIVDPSSNHDGITPGAMPSDKLQRRALAGVLVRALDRAASTWPNRVESDIPNALAIRSTLLTERFRAPRSMSAM